MAAALVLLFALWIATSTLSQLPKLRERFDRPWLRVLVPSWSLFTDPMLRFDFTLMSRIELREGEFSDWTIHDMVPETGPLRVLWNPAKRLAARFREAVTIILSTRLLGERGSLDDATPVRALAHFVAGHYEQGRRVQFCVVMDDASQDAAPASILYMSRVYEA